MKILVCSNLDNTVYFLAALQLFAKHAAQFKEYISKDYEVSQQKFSFHQSLFFFKSVFLLIAVLYCTYMF